MTYIKRKTYQISMELAHIFYKGLAVDEKNILLLI